MASDHLFRIIAGEAIDLPLPANDRQCPDRKTSWIQRQTRRTFWFRRALTARSCLDRWSLAIECRPGSFARCGQHLVGLGLPAAQCSPVQLCVVPKTRRLVQTASRISGLLSRRSVPGTFPCTPKCPGSSFTSLRPKRCRCRPSKLKSLRPLRFSLEALTPTPEIPNPALNP